MNHRMFILAPALLTAPTAPHEDDTSTQPERVVAVIGRPEEVPLSFDPRWNRKARRAAVSRQRRAPR
jgi:hypothetical protein